MDAKLIMQLRETTGAGIVDAKKALEETGGDLGKAAELLRTKGIIKAAGKAERATNEGRVVSYIHHTGTLGVLVEVLCETDFVARTGQFGELAHDIALQVASSNPLYVSPEQIPAEVIEKEREMAIAEVGAGKPAEIMDKIIAGKLEKWYGEVCLLRQPFIKDEDLTIEEYLKTAIAKLGENIQIRRFCRFSLGE